MEVTMKKTEYEKQQEKLERDDTINTVIVSFFGFLVLALLSAFTL
tara:strand:+ start:55 stop:189 length:135 start_codon:yes stop_codon:yes gene_type:complete